MEELGEGAVPWLDVDYVDLQEGHFQPFTLHEDRPSTKGQRTPRMWVNEESAGGGLCETLLSLVLVVLPLKMLLRTTGRVLGWLSLLSLAPLTSAHMSIW